MANALKELGAENPNVIVLDADLAGATKTGVFKKAFPDRFFDCGIAESNMMAIAAGVATTGKIPSAAPSRCSRQAALTSRYATQLDIPT